MAPFHRWGNRDSGSRAEIPTLETIAHFFYFDSLLSCLGLPGPMFVQTATWARSSFDIIYTASYYESSGAQNELSTLVSEQVEGSHDFTFL